MVTKRWSGWHIRSVSEPTFSTGLYFTSAVLHQFQVGSTLLGFFLGEAKKKPRAAGLSHALVTLGYALSLHPAGLPVPGGRFCGALQLRGAAAWLQRAAWERTAGARLVPSSFQASGGLGLCWPRGSPPPFWGAVTKKVRCVNPPPHVFVLQRAQVETNTRGRLISLRPPFGQPHEK